MAYPAIDADTIAAYELDELPDGALLAPVAGFLAPFGDAFDVGDAPRFQAKFHSPPHFGGWVGFADAVSGNLDGVLYDSLPASDSFYTIGVPGLFGEQRAVGFWQGTATADRDYLVLPSGPGAGSQLTTSLWFQPFQPSAAVQELLHKEYLDCQPTDGVLNTGAWVSPFYGAMQFFVPALSDGSWGASINIGGTVHTVTVSSATTERIRLRFGLWNHLGATYDGSHFCLYINGMLAGRVALSGAIDYGAGAWVCGATRAGTISSVNGIVERIRWERVAKGLDYFFDCYTNARGGGGGSPPVVGF